jgi:hypothetical protein
VVDVQLRPGDEPVHQPGVGQRDDRVVVAGHDERARAQPRQERHAGPARRGGELVQVAAREPGPVVVVHGRRDLFRVDSRQPAVDVAGDPPQVLAIQVAPRRHHVPEHLGPGRDHHQPGGGRHQHQAAAPGALERGEVLGDPATPGDSEHVDLVVSDFGQHAGDQPAQPAEPVRPGRPGRAADAGRVEPDHLDGRVERGHERREQFEVGANTVDEQEGDPGRPAWFVLSRSYRHPQQLPADRDGTDLSGRRHRFPARRIAPGGPGRPA